MNSVEKLSAILGIFSDSSYPLCEVGQLSSFLDLPVLTQPPTSFEPGQFVLVINSWGLSLESTGRGASGPVSVDFVQGATAHRRHFGGGKSQLIAKAVGIKGRFRPNILDLTAGLGQDAFVLATLGCHVTLVERVAFVFQLLNDGLQRAQHFGDDDLKAIIERMVLVNQQSYEYLNELSQAPDIIYLDPMFPEREKRAKVKKNMAAFQCIVGGDVDAGELLALSLQTAKYRVVIKRPRKAPSLSEQYPLFKIPGPGLVLEGKSSRYDIYPLARMPD